MPNVTIYTTQVCPYCVRAKKLLQAKGISWEEIDVAESKDLREQMIDLAGGRKSVPQIFINNRHIGGFDDLHALEKAGELDALLQ